MGSGDDRQAADTGDGLPPPDTEMWTTGQVATYLQAIDGRFSRKLVTYMVKRGEMPAYQRGPRAWTKIPARWVREYGARLASVSEHGGPVVRGPRARIGRIDPAPPQQ